MLDLLVISNSPKTCPKSPPAPPAVNNFFKFGLKVPNGRLGGKFVRCLVLALSHSNGVLIYHSTEVHTTHAAFLARMRTILPVFFGD